MKKIPTIFKRDPENRSSVINEPHPACGWVFAGEGVATKKYDGTCVKIVNGCYFKRREIKPGNKPPADFIEEQADEVTGKRVGWVRINPKAKEDQWYMEALNTCYPLPNGTYELVGPKIQGNPEGFAYHVLIKHSDAWVFKDVPRTYEGLAAFMSDKDIEGIVFHHPDGRMAKIKKRDFGQKRV